MNLIFRNSLKNEQRKHLQKNDCFTFFNNKQALNHFNIIHTHFGT